LSGVEWVKITYLCEFILLTFAANIFMARILPGGWFTHTWYMNSIHHVDFHAEYPAVNLSAQTSPDTRRWEPSIVYARVASQRGSYLASIVIDLHTTLYIV
jgi:hypothetical protein